MARMDLEALEVSSQTKRITRTKTGCLTCRLRRKKCEEQRPSCNGCTRNSLICSWPADPIPQLSHPQERVTQGITLEAATAPKEETSNTYVSTKNGGVGDGDQSSVRSNAKSYRKTSAPIHWSPILPTTLSFRPKSLDHEVSYGLFQHYIASTAVNSYSRSDSENPYLTYLLPLACANDAVLESILALSGTQLAFKDRSFEVWSLSHYAIALKSVKYGLTSLVEGDSSQLLATLVAALLLSHREVLAGDTNGAAQRHLRACRELLLRAQNTETHIDPRLRDFLLELYAYTAIVCNNVIFGLDSETNDPCDDDSLWFSILGLNQDSGIYGFMFGFAHELFDLIPKVTAFARQATCAVESEEMENAFTVLQQKISTWRLPVVPGGSNSSSDQHNGLVARLYQQALLVFLYTSRLGKTLPTSSERTLIDTFIEAFLTLLEELPSDSAAWTTMFWPLLIVGSCSTQTEQQLVIAAAFSRNTRLHTWMMRRCLELLHWIWMDISGALYGPYGVELISRSNNRVVCLA